MFEYVFRCYKAASYNETLLATLKKMTWTDRGIFAGVIVSAVIGLSLTISQNQWGVIILFLVFICPPVITAYTNNKMQNNRHEKLDEYLQNRIAPLTELLKGENYNCFNQKSVDWLIERCDDMASYTNKSPLQGAVQPVLPFLTLALGALLAQMDSQTVIVIVVVLGVIVLCLYTYANIEDMFLGADKRLAKTLKTDLQYISTLLPDQKI